MKKLALLAMCLALPFAVRAQTVGTHHTVQAQFGQPLDSGAWPMRYCSTAVTTACVKSYTEKLTAPSGTSPAAIVISAGSTDIAGAVITHNYTPGGLLFCGTWNLTVVANWIDNSGVAQDSVPLTGSIQEPCPFVASPPATGTLKLSVQ